MIKDEWQERWNRSESGFATKDILPSVSIRVNLPDDRNTGISFVRSLIGMADVNEIMHRFKYSESPICQCGPDIETVDHVLFDCELYDIQRMIMINALKNLWMNSNKAINLVE